MRIYLYSEMQRAIEKSGVGRAIYHQRTAAKRNSLELVNRLEEADLVHINTVFLQSFLLAGKARKKGIPVVYHAHSTREDFKNSYIGSNLFAPLFGKWITCCYNRGDVIITPTEYSRRLLQSYGIKKPIEVLSNGISLSYYDKTQVDTMAFRRKFGYDTQAKIVMGVGLLIDRKGICDFVELAGRLPQYQFIWFGESNLHTVPAKIRKAVQTRLPNLRFAGYASPELLREAYGSCNLFLFPSKEETEGIVVLEALAMKIPILLRDIPVYSDWLQADREVYKAGNLDEFQSKLVKMLEGEVPDLTGNGYKKAQERSIEKIGARLKQIYRHCLESV